jgi:uncharacterized protein YgiM (DUF1202 family)
MANTDQPPVQLDAMIARLEKANARAYENFAPQVRGKNEGAKHYLADRLSTVPNGQSSRTTQSRIALIALLLAACTCAAAVAWEPSYGKRAQRFARWANPWVSQGLPHAQTVSREGVPAASPISPDVTQRLERMAERLANMEQQIEQLKASQKQTIQSDTAVSEQFKAAQQQMVGDNAKAVEQINVALAQLDRQNTVVARQLKATQEQLAGLASLRASYGWKHLRRSPNR